MLSLNSKSVSTSNNDKTLTKILDTINNLRNSQVTGLVEINIENLLRIENDTSKVDR